MLYCVYKKESQGSGNHVGPYIRHHGSFLLPHDAGVCLSVAAPVCIPGFGLQGRGLGLRVAGLAFSNELSELRRG